MFYHELANPPVSSCGFWLPPYLPGHHSLNRLQICRLLVHARGQGDYAKVLGGDVGRT